LLDRFIRIASDPETICRFVQDWGPLELHHVLVEDALRLSEARQDGDVDLPNLVSEVCKTYFGFKLDVAKMEAQNSKQNGRRSVVATEMSRPAERMELLSVYPALAS